MDRHFLRRWIDADKYPIHYSLHTESLLPSFARGQTVSGKGMTSLRPPVRHLNTNYIQYHNYNSCSVSDPNQRSSGGKILSNSQVLMPILICLTAENKIHIFSITLYVLALWQSVYEMPMPTVASLALGRHQMKIFPALLSLYEGNSPVTGEYPSQRPVTRSFDVFFDLWLNKRLSKQSWYWWFETPSRSWWRHFNVKQRMNKTGEYCN